MNLREKLESEKLDAPWGDLAPHFARGVLVLCSGPSVIDVGEAFARDEKHRVQAWLADGQVRLCAEDDGHRYATSRPRFEFVIVQPFVIASEQVRPVE